ATVDSFKAYCNRAGVSKDEQERVFNTPLKVDIARLTRHTEEFYTVLSSLGICSKAPIGLLYSMDDCADLVAASLGVECDAVSLKRDAERVWNLYRLLNAREGFSRKDDTYPPLWLAPMNSDGGPRPLMDYFETRTLTAGDLETMLDDYYDERGWDRETGQPSFGKLSELGLLEMMPASGR
ncbi:MAG: aldehyde ferredoxin oxidoreductase C-terminal domain-containing protein, partial [Bacillota bacterium]